MAREGRHVPTAAFCGDQVDFIVSWREACVRPIDGTVDPLNQDSHIAGNVAAMGDFDWAAVLFTAVVVALAVVAELKDITMCTVAIRYAGEKLSPGWQFILTLLGGMRRCVFLPMLVWAVPALVLFKGGDALSVSMNAVAILFLCDIDNMAYDRGLGEEVRMRVEESGRVDLGEAEATALVLTKAVHVGLIVVLVPYLVWSEDLDTGLSLAFLAFWLGGVAGAVGAGGGAAAVCKGVRKATEAGLLGFVAFFMLVLNFVTN